MYPQKLSVAHIIQYICGVVFLLGTTSQLLLGQDNTTPVIRPETTRGSTQELIQMLETQSGWTISYSTRLCRNETIILSNQPRTLLQHLDDIFKDCPFTYIIRDQRLILQPIDPGKMKFTVSGFIREAGSLESLPAANIYDARSQTGTVSNNYGFYSISLPAGEQKLTASYVGYAGITDTFQLNKDTIIHFQMSASVELQQVDIIGDQTDGRINTTLMGKTFIPIGHIRQSPALLGESDLVKSIQMLPGIQGGSEGFSGLYVRGGGPDQNLILLDDVPVYNIGHLLGFFSVFNADAVKQVSVLKSGFPARHGGRLSSVIDIRMLEGNNERVEGTLNLGLLSSGISLNGPVRKDRSGFAVSFRRTYMDAIAAIAQSGRDETANYYFFDLNAKYNHTLNNRNRIYLSTYWGRDKYYTTYNYVDVTLQPAGGDTNENITSINDENNAGWGNFVTALRWNHIFSPRLFGNLTATYSDYRFFIGVQRTNEINNSLDSFEQRYVSGIHDLSVKLDFDYYPANNHLIKFGVNAIRHEFNPGVDIIQRSINTTQPVDTVISDIRLTGGEYHGYLEDEFTIAERLRLNVGGRMILFNSARRIYHSLEPRISFNFTLQPGWNIRGSYSQMSQFIHLVSSSNVTLPTDLWLPVTDKIPPMYSRQISLGNDWALDTYQNFTIGLDVYYKRLENLLHYKESTGFFDYSTEWEDKLTGGSGRSKGIEMIFRKIQGDLTGWLGYTLAKTTNTFEELNDGKPFPARFDRRHDIHLNINYRFNRNIDGSLTWQYGSGTPITLPSEKYFAPDHPFENGQTNRGYSENAMSLNGFRMPAFHRLDVGFNFTKQRNSSTRIWSVGIINVYSRQNPFLLYFASDSNSEPGSAQRNLKQLSLFPFPIPYVRYTLNF